MKIVFGREHFSAGLPWQGLEPFLPGHEIITCTRETLASRIEDADVVVPFGTLVDRTLIDRGHFGLIQQFGVGLDTVDIEAATQAGVWVARLPAENTGNANSVAELAIMQMLMLSRRLPLVQAAWREGRWAQPPGVALVGKTACIVGLGDVGMALARRLHAFGMQLIGVRRDSTREAPTDPPFARLFDASDLPAALREADYTLICVNYTPENYHLLNEQAFRAMKAGSFFFNVSRGGLVDYDALLVALQSGQLEGAGLDVFWEEPVGLDHPLFQQNVVATPHIAGITDAFYFGGVRIFAENIERYAQGEQPRYAVNNVTQPRFLRGKTG